MSNFPHIFRVRQTFDATRVADVATEVHAQLDRLHLADAIRPGQSVALTAGSRGIANLPVILRAIVEYLNRLEARPFLVPAMGSHGGGTAEGQARVLESYGITESAVGCPLRSSLETVVVCRTAEGIAVHFDRLAYEADHVLICNRIKPHTMFAGRIQSGLMKMLLIGLGNREGAAVYHRAVEDHSFDQIVRGAAGEVIRRCRIVGGVGILENAYDQTARIEALRPDEFEAREPELLELARAWMPRLPFREVDLLLIDRIGKNISGVGFDSNIVGRKFDDHKAVEGEWPKVRRIAVRRLTPESHGNANGLGMAEFCRGDLIAQADLEATRLNAMTAGHVTAAMLPLDYPTDRRMLAAALTTIGLREPPEAKFLWISDTLHLAEVECSVAYLDEAKQRDDLTILTAPRALPFNAEGDLPDWEARA